MCNIFLWCECSYTAMGIAELFDNKFNVSVGDKTQDLTDTIDYDWYIFVVSSDNIFDIATIIRNDTNLSGNDKVLLLAEKRLIKPLGFLCGQDVKSMSMTQFYCSHNGIIEGSLYLNLDLNENIHDKVTPTELAVMRLIMKGDTVSEVAFRLNKSIKTISRQKIVFLKRIGIKNRLASLYRYFYTY